VLESRTPVAAAAPQAGRARGPVTVPAGDNMSLPWFGWALACTGCGWEQERDDAHPRWESSEPPLVHAVEPGGPAAAAGIQAGDRVVAIQGVPITSRDGGARLGGARAGAALDIAVERDGRRRDLRIVPGAPRTSASRAPLPPRYRGRVGAADIEVDSAGSVVVTLNDAGDEMVITTPTTTVRVKVKGTR
jgi:membrane-associated protease RseP (regulator of RpoE activity)